MLDTLALRRLPFVRWYERHGCCGCEDIVFSCCLVLSWAVVCYYLIVSAHIIWVERRREGKGMGICISESPRLGSAVFFLFHLLVFFLSVECGMIADEGCNDE